MNNFSFTIGQKVLYKKEQCVIIDLSWMTANIQFSNGTTKLVFKSKLKRINEKVD